MRIEKDRLNLWLEAARQYYLKLSQREKLLIISFFTLAVIILIQQAYLPVQSAFARQKVELERIERDAETITFLLDRHLRLMIRKEEIESSYREVEMKEGVLSYLETLIRDKGGIESGYQLRDNQPRDFAGQYEQTPFTIRFSTTSLPRLVDLLTEIVHGPRPLILTRLDMRRGSRIATSGAQPLNVEIDVSSLRRIESSE